MSIRAYHPARGDDTPLSDHRDRRYQSNAGLLGLEAELWRRSDYELADQISLLVEVLPTMADVALPRLRIASWLLRERLAGAA